jgi:hypothetical protein
MSSMSGRGYWLGTVHLLSCVTAMTATLLSQDSELLDAQVESRRDEQESRGATPRGVCLKVITLEGP